MLLPGLSSEQIQSFKSALDVDLPEEFKLFYQWKNGHSNSKRKALWYNRSLMNVEAILQNWTEKN
jgi:cell wall assembly regulator SMI1